jgi:large subunit ribosomal protein L4
MENTGEITLSDTVFAVEVKGPLIHEAVKAALANKRRGTASTKTRAEVKASGAKPYRQKGTGRARHGSWVSPLFVGGGITFGPKPRSFSLKMTKKKRHAALRSALSMKVKENQLLVIDEWVEKKKTKEMAKVLDTMKVKNALIVVDEPTEWLERTVRNIPYIDVTYTRMLNTYNIVAHDFLICTKDVVAKIEEGLEK